MLSSNFFAKINQVNKVICGKNWYSGIVIFLIIFFLFSRQANAEEALEIKEKIKDTAIRIEQLEKDIRAYKNEVLEISHERESLSGVVKQIDAEHKKISGEVHLTEEKISLTDLEISDLQNTIFTLEDDIETNKGAISLSLRRVRQIEEETFIERIITSNSLGGFLKLIDQIALAQVALHDSVKNLESKKNDLTEKWLNTNEKKEQLASLREEIEYRREIAARQKYEKEVLLKETKQKEDTYKKILDEKLRLQQEFEDELFQYESELKFLSDPTLLPARGSQVLSWPVDDVLITQRFGVTSDSARLYLSGSHSGTDFRGNGDPVYAMADGIVLGVGDTDIACRGASFGKWVLIKYNNNLASTYGHLSTYTVRSGQTVRRGEVVGYSGSTGRVTGPHLHVSLYAGIDAVGETPVKVEGKESIACKGKILVQPRAPRESYLDLLDYTPPTTSSMFK